MIQCYISVVTWICYPLIAGGLVLCPWTCVCKISIFDGNQNVSLTLQAIVPTSSAVPGQTWCWQLVQCSTRWWYGHQAVVAMVTLTMIRLCLSFTGWLDIRQDIVLKDFVKNPTIVTSYHGLCCKMSPLLICEGLSYKNPPALDLDWKLCCEIHQYQVIARNCKIPPAVGHSGRLCCKIPPVLDHGQSLCCKIPPVLGPRRLL